MHLVSVVQLELLGIVNLLQIIFLGIQLDGVVSWSWAVSDCITTHWQMCVLYSSSELTDTSL